MSAADLFAGTINDVNVPLVDTELISHDLRFLLRNVGGVQGVGPGITPPAERPEVERPVEVLDEAADISEGVELLNVSAFVDGIQATVLLGYREYRPFYLRYLGAGAVGHGGAPAGCLEQLEVAGGASDAEWLREQAGTITVFELAGETPDDVIRSAIATTGSRRERLERDLAVQLIDQTEDHIVVDGSLVGRPQNSRLCGVVKDSSRRYLPDERVLWTMQAGWRSPRFKIQAGTDMGCDRYSCYVRLHSNRNQRWNFGLVRVEAFDLELLDSLAARALVERQTAGSKDGRWERHLSPVRMTEDFLRGRRPAVFGMM